jgi:hypothetical protein
MDSVGRPLEAENIPAYGSSGRKVSLDMVNGRLSCTPLPTERETWPP